MRNAAPFRADHVGSLLRPEALSKARERHRAGEISDEALRALEDREIEAVVRRQEALGLQSATDGEWRRAAWHRDFLQGLKGIEPAFDAVLGRNVLKVTGPIDFDGHPMLGHFRFLAGQASTALPKMTIPSPSMLVSALRDWRSVVATAFYRDLEHLHADLGRAYGKAVRAFYEAGCRYLQFDDCNFAYLCDPVHRERLRNRGDDPDALLSSWGRMVNAALAGRPGDMVVSTHVCRGNRQSTWLATGGYEPIADALFNQMDFDAYFLEYDDERAGGFEPLRWFPKSGDKVVVLGLVTTKTGALEAVDAIARRIDQAASFVPIERLCISPQCGFASTEEGNALTADQQWAKLERLVETARIVWR